jgi:hypothetical protein
LHLSTVWQPERAETETSKASNSLGRRVICVVRSTRSNAERRVSASWNFGPLLHAAEREDPGEQ